MSAHFRIFHDFTFTNEMFIRYNIKKYRLFYIFILFERGFVIENYEQ